MDMVKIAGQVAAELGDGWAATPGHWGNHRDAFVVNKGVPGKVHLAIRDGRIRIGGSLPEGWHRFTPSSYDADAPKDRNISVALDKSPARIAADMRRRLLPAWKAYTDAVAARKARRDEYEANRDGAAERLVGMVSGAVRQDDGAIDLGRVAGVSYGTVVVGEDGGVHVQSLALTPEGATAFFRALGRLTKD